MRYSITTELEASQSEVWELLQQSATLCFLAKGMVTYTAAEDFPTRWELGKPVNLRPSLFGVLPAGDHFVTFEYRNFTEGEFRTKESGAPFRSWNHSMKLVAIDEHRCRYTDTIEFDAGVLNPLGWLFVRSFYKHRHRRWPLLIEQKWADAL